MALAIIMIIVGFCILAAFIEYNEGFAGIGLLLIIFGIGFCADNRPTELERQRVLNKELKQEIWRKKHPKKEDIILQKLKQENAKLKDSLR